MKYTGVFNLEYKYQGTAPSPNALCFFTNFFLLSNLYALNCMRNIYFYRFVIVIYFIEILHTEMNKAHNKLFECCV